MKKLVLTIAVVLILVLGVGVYSILTRPKLTDTKQIQALLLRGQAAIEKKNVKEAMSCLSAAYKDSAGYNYDTMRFQVIEAFKSDAKYEVDLKNTSIVINGDTAHVQAYLVFSMTQELEHQTQNSNGMVGIDLKKEDSKRWLVFPTKTWKITSISGGPSMLDE